MDLLTPVTYRLKHIQDAWLQARADKQGHGSKAVVLRLLLDQAMRSNLKKASNGKKRAA